MLLLQERRRWGYLEWWSISSHTSRTCLKTSHSCVTGVNLDVSSLCRWLFPGWQNQCAVKQFHSLTLARQHVPGVRPFLSWSPWMWTTTSCSVALVMHKWCSACTQAGSLASKPLRICSLSLWPSDNVAVCALLIFFLVALVMAIYTVWCCPVPPKGLCALQTPQELMAGSFSWHTQIHNFQH